MDPIKVQGVMDWPQPTKVKDIQSFIGFVNFYQRFIQNFSEIAHTLHVLTQKSKDWSWGAAEQQAFNALKNAITSTPMLTFPSRSGLFSDTEQNYQIHDKEMLAIMHALEEWRHFLEGSDQKFEIHTDHKNLSYFQEAHKLNCCQA